MNINELLLVLTVSATLAAIAAKQLKDARELDIAPTLNQAIAEDNYRRQLAYEIMSKQPPEDRQLTAEQIADLLLELEDLDPEAADRLIQQLGKLLEQQ